MTSHHGMNSAARQAIGCCLAAGRAAVVCCSLVFGAFIPPCLAETRGATSLTAPTHEGRVPVTLTLERAESHTPSFLPPTLADNDRQRWQRFVTHCNEARWDDAIAEFQHFLDTRPIGLVSETPTRWNSFDLALHNRMRRLPADGREAFALFFESDADVLWTRVATNDRERTILHDLVTYFPFTRYARLAADRLGDLQFEAGSFVEAIKMWQVACESTSGDMPSNAQLSAKMVVAASRAGLTRLREQLCDALRREHAGESIVQQSESVGVAKWLDRLPRRDTATSIASEEVSGRGETENAKDIVAAEIVWRRRLPRELDQRPRIIAPRGIAPSRPSMISLPACAASRENLYVLTPTELLALRMPDGEPQWKSTQLASRLPIVPRSNPTMPAESSRDVTIAVDHRHQVWNLVPIGRRSGETELVGCSAETGKVVFRSRDVPALADWNPVGDLHLWQDLLCVAAMHAHVPERVSLFAIDTGDRTVRWSVPLGETSGGKTLRVAPSLLARGDQMVIVVDELAILMTLDLPTATLKRVTKLTADAAWSHDASIGRPACYWLDQRYCVLKPAGLRRLIAYDTLRDTIAWQAPAFRDSFLAAADAHHVMTCGQEITLYDSRSGAMVWTMTCDRTPCWPMLAKQAVWFAARDMVWEVSRGSGAVMSRHSVATQGGSARVEFMGDHLIVVTDEEVVALSMRSHPRSLLREEGAPDDE